MLPVVPVLQGSAISRCGCLLTMSLGGVGGRAGGDSGWRKLGSILCFEYECQDSSDISKENFQ